MTTLYNVWTSQNTVNNNKSWWGVTYGNNVFVAVSITGVMTSSNGTDWIPQTSPTFQNGSWRAVTYGFDQSGNGLFVAVAYTGDNRVMTSPNGITWTSITSPINDWGSITYGNGLFVAIAYSSVDSNYRVMTSPDGVNWTSRTTANSSNAWQSVTFGFDQSGNGLFVAVSSSTTRNGDNKVMTSPNGISWTLRTAANNNKWTSVTYGPSNGSGLFVAVSQSGNNTGVMTSPDGIIWTSRTSPINNWYSVTYGYGQFVAVAYTGVGDRVMSSIDGITWNSETSAADNDWVNVTYGSGQFAAVSNTGIGNRVMTKNIPPLLPKPTPTIGPLIIPRQMNVSESYTITKPTSNSSGTFIYTSSNPSVENISSNILTAVGVGSTTIIATQTETWDYTSGSVYAISSTCFPAGTLISCNQGEIPIELINPDIHTIRGKKIVTITKTIIQNKYLICFEKGSLGNNIPNRQTIMSKNHQLFYNGEMIKAVQFASKFENVTKLKYTGEVLYNILMGKHDKMVVNNLICETLNPESDIAKLHTIVKDMSSENKIKFIQKYNKTYIEKNKNKKMNIK